MRQFFRGGIVSRNAGVEAPVDSRSLLDASTDFTYLGRYTAAAYGGFNDTDHWAQGLTHRYVDGTFRLMWLGFGGNGSSDANLHPIREATLPGSYGSNLNIVATHTSTWSDMNGGGFWHSVWWDDINNLAWTSSGIDYPDDTQGLATASMQGRAIGTSSGSCSGYTGYHGLYGIQQRASMGKMGRTPVWTRTTYGFKEFYSLSGGYASRMSYGVSLGPIFTSFDDPLDFTASSSPVTIDPTIPQASVQVLADLRSGTSGTDWYAGGYASRTKERGCRITNVQNEYDNGGWLSKPDLQPPGDPDGWNRWTWGDTFGGSGNWIDNDAGTRTKHGIVMIQKLCTGRAWYEGSQLNNTGNGYEIAVYDPADLYAVKQGSLDAWKVRPKSLYVIPTSDIISTGSLEPHAGVFHGATFDATTNRLYVMIARQNLLSQVLVYQVAGA